MQRRITMSDIAREAGVSKNTVSLALRGSVEIPPATRRRIQRIADRLGYSKHPVVAHLMAELRASQAPAFRSTLALLNANIDREAFRRHPTVPTYVEGCRRRAAQLGYALDEFWLHDPDLDGSRLNRIFKSRGIRAALIVGLMKENRLPGKFRATWEQFPCVVTGVRTEEPALSFACVDHHMLAISAFQHAVALGYRRPALVLDSAIDMLVNGRFTAGFLIAQQVLPQANRIAPFHDVTAARADTRHFHAWFERERPDVILTLYHEVQRWLEAMGRFSPRDIGLIQLEWRSNHSEWAGMNQHNDVAGETAVDMVVGMIHRAEAGPPDFPRGTLVGSTWVDGATVCANAPMTIDNPPTARRKQERRRKGS